MKSFWKYLSNRKTIVWMLFIFWLTALLITFLYSLRWEAFWYGSAIAAVFLVLFMGFDLYRFQEQNKVWKLVLNQEKLLDIDLSKCTSDLLLQEVFKKIEKEEFERQENEHAKYGRLIDYFTLWTHQIKIPISAMELLLKNDPERVMDLKEEALQIKRYTDMVMAYLRLESESGDYVFENVDLDEVIASVIREFSIEFIYRKIPIDFQKTNLIVLSDRKWLRFALEQFLSNAIKYSEGQKITIRNIGYDLFIEDRGIGISKQDLERIREKGYTGHNGRLYSKESSGLGLYLSDIVLKRLHHPYTIESKVGKGTTIILSLQRHDLFKDDLDLGS
ncbi:sensor histidine kinase [Dubosiella newyorkensis]|uniref:sensor histidine kinase n=1 Tax=Dubosiella newyorkensis TaxID=1862672 RepID=UPI00272D473F|nr:sensor histidine kinase [Dubosiella newyorkensis]